MYDIKGFYQAASVNDALTMLQNDEQSLIIAGGTDILIRLRDGKDTGRQLISIHRMQELCGIEELPDGSILIKPATCFCEIVENPIIQKYIPALAEAVDQIGGPQVRRTGTIGGNICNGAVSADSNPTLLVLDAELEIEDAMGKSHMPLKTFHIGPGKTQLKQNQILTGIRIAKKNYENFCVHYIKYGQRNAMEIATVGCAVSVRLNQTKDTIEEMKIAFGVVAPTPIRCEKVEKEVVGRKINAETMNWLGNQVLKEVNPRDSWRASRELRLQLVRELSKRVLKEAIIRAGGKIDA